MRPGLAASLALTCLVCFGCARTPRDPLDWKVEAKTPADLEDWLAAMEKKLTPGLDYEVVRSLKAIAGNLPYYRGYNEHRYHATDDALCVAVNQLPIRRLIQHGYDALGDSLRLEINRDLENSVRTLGQDSADPRQDYIDHWNLTVEGTQIERDEAMLAVCKARIAVLEPSDP